MCRDRLIRYAKIGTQSAPHSRSTPSTECQKALAEELYRELEDLGADDVYYDEKSCVVYAKIKSNLDGGKDDAPIGFVAHIDTAPGAPGDGVAPRVIYNYDGGDIILNEEKGIVMRASEFKNLSRYKGCDLVTTDGTTLLGGDDKAAIASVMTAAEYLISHSEVKHGTVCIALTPDEEVGGLAKDVDLKRFGAPVAYTIDGDHLGYYTDETFNASEAVIEIKGFSVHTATAKGIMKNAVDIACEFMSSLPEDERPQNTEGEEGFYHVVSCDATCEYAKIELIIRDFDRGAFERREEFIRKIAADLNGKYGGVTCGIFEQYRNMREVIDTVPYTVENLKRAITECGVTPVNEPFRGGTDGAALSFRGLPCPNLSAGYENAHGRFEYVPVQSMAKNVEILLKLIGIYAS
ncbi:MAG: peptidase T [Clostridia bacterium]|nr:peptidase T [Clostridia bacterium]